jgi:hypothetical protein
MRIGYLLMGTVGDEFIVRSSASFPEAGISPPCDQDGGEPFAGS